MEENRKDNKQKKVKSCAVCTHRRKKCNKDCPLAPYFPADNPQLFKTVHRCFGVTYMINALRSTPPDLRDDLMTSIIYSANARVIDPVRGCLGEIQTLLSKIMYAQKELDCLRSLIQQFANQNDQNQRFDNQHFENPQSIPTFHEPQLVNTQHRASDDVPLFADDYVVDEAVINECHEQQFQNQHFENQQYMPSFHEAQLRNNQYSAIDNDLLPSYDYVTEADLFECNNQDFQNIQSMPSSFPQPQLVNTQHRACNDDVPLSVDDYVVDEAVFYECPDQQFQNQHFENQQYMPSFHQPLNGNNQYSAIDNDPLPSYDNVTETDLFECNNQEFQNIQSMPSSFPQSQLVNTQHRTSNDDVPLSVDDYVVDEAVFVECPDQQFQNQHFENQQYMSSFNQPQHGNNQYSAIDNDPLPSFNYVTETDLFGCINHEFQNQQSMCLLFSQRPQPGNTH